MERIIMGPFRDNPRLELLFRSWDAQRGQRELDDRTDALCYSRRYQLMHLEAWQRLLQRHSLISPHVKPLIIDIGSGPGTVSLAFGRYMNERFKSPLAAHHIGIERWQAAVDLHEEYLHDPALFVAPAPDATVDTAFARSTEELQDSWVEDLAEDCNALFVCFSYVLNQNAVSDAEVRAWAAAIQHWSLITTLPTSVLAVDVPIGNMRGPRKIISALESLGEVSHWSGVDSYEYRRFDLHLDGPREISGPGHASYYWTQLSGARRSSMLYF